MLHVIHRLAVGGLENGLVNLLNLMPPDRYRHAIVCLTEATDFRERLHRHDIPIISLRKRPGQDLRLHARVWHIVRDLRPDIVHTRNFPTLEYLVTAAAAGVSARVHGEHGRDIYDLDGLKRKYNLLRKAVRPFVHRYIAVSRELTNWLVDIVGAHPARVTQICNGVDLDRFAPAREGRSPIGPPGCAGPGTVVVGSVGRFEPVKDPLTLVRAFLGVVARRPEAKRRLRLVLIGSGSLYETARETLRAADADQYAWLPGEREDIPDIMRGMDMFVLPSLREGISNTILEAMASGLPIVTTRVGGSPELVVDGETGTFVPPAQPTAMTDAIERYALDSDRMRRHGQAGRRRAEERFGISAMVQGYLSVYDQVLHQGNRSSSMSRALARCAF